jgi:hypothetical protein
MGERVRQHIRQNVVGYVALFLVVTGGTAYATHPGGADTISSPDIINNEVQTADIRDANVNTADIRGDAVTTNKIADGEVRSADVLDDALTGADIQDLFRAVNLPLASFVNRNDDATLDFNASNGTSPDFLFSPSSVFLIEWDADTDGGGPDAADEDEITTGFTVPPDWVPGGQLSFALRASKSGHSGVDERFLCRYLNDTNSSFGMPAVVTTSASRATYVFDVSASGVSNTDPGDAAQLICRVDDGALGGFTADNAVRLHSVEFRYSATQ